MVLSARVLGQGRPVLLLPWFGTDQAVMAAAFEPVFTGLDGWRRIYPDLPGTGGSPPGEPCSDAVLAVVAETATALAGGTPFLLAGCSYGGYLAAGLARRMPDQVAGLLLVCAGVKISPAGRDLSGVLPSVPEPGWLGDVPPDLHEHFRQAIGHQTRQAAGRVADALGRRGTASDEYLAALREGAGYQLSDENSPAGFGNEVTIVAGRQDRIAGYRDLFAALSRYPRGSFIALADAGHYLPFEQPAWFRAVMLDWLARHEPGAGPSAGH